MSWQDVWEDVGEGTWEVTYGYVSDWHKFISELFVDFFQKSYEFCIHNYPLFLVLGCAFSYSALNLLSRAFRSSKI